MPGELGDSALIAPADQVTADSFDEQQVLAGIVEAEQDKWPQEPGVGSGGEWDDFYRDAWLLTDIE